MRGPLALVTMMGLIACGSRGDIEPADAAPDSPTDAHEPGRALDILLVIEDTPVMTDKRTNLLNNYPNYANVLQNINGGLPDLHLAVVTTDLGTKGAADAQPGAAIGGTGAGACSGLGKNGAFHTASSVTGSYIIDVANADGTRTTNYTGTLAAAVSALADVGNTGCAFAQPLQAAKLALSSNAPAQASFLRPRAPLAIIFIGTNDDCSLAHSTLLGSDTATLGPLSSFRCNRFGHVCAMGGLDSTQMNQVGPKGGCRSNEASAYLAPVADYVTYFQSLKPDPDRLIIGAVAGPDLPYEVELRTPPGGGTAIPDVAPSCSYVGGTGNPEVAEPAVRMRDFLGAFPNHSTFQTICQPDLSGVLTQIASYTFGS